MKILLTLAVALAALAQETPAPASSGDAKAADAKQADSKSADAKPADAAAPAAAASPVPTGEKWVTGFIDLGYRWRTDVGGSKETYRSIVNLGSGLKLIGTEFTVIDPKHRLFDRVDVRAYDWDDPYATFHLTARKGSLYELNVDNRNYAFFDNMPSFADPRLAIGVMLNENSFDTHRKLGSYSLDLFPGNWLIPYLAYDHDANSGTGVTSFVSTLQEYPVLSTMFDSTENYRGGVRIELRRFHVTLEQGGTTFKSGQNAYVPPGGKALPYPSSVVQGQTLGLTSLAQAYGIRGSSIYSKVLASAHATNWLDITGQFLYSLPSTDVNYQQYNYGAFTPLNQALVYNSEQFLLTGAAKLPHSSGQVGSEIRPLKRVRIVDSWTTDRLHNAGSANQSDLLGTKPPQTTTLALNSLLYSNYNQAEGIVFVDVYKGLVARAGYRYVWGDSNALVLPPAGLVSNDFVKIRRNVGLFGLTYRHGKWSASADTEVASSGGADFRTSLYDYQRVRGHINYQLLATLNVAFNLSVQQNNNPQVAIKSDYLSHLEAFNVQWNPKAKPVKHLTFLGTWEHQSVSSDILYLIPQTLTQANSHYWESGNTFTGLIAAAVPVKGKSIQFSGGGSFLLSDGTRATNYYQPVGRLSVPVLKNLAWNTEWRYYGFGEAAYLYESFRTHLVTTGLRFTR
jgi:hypothetical protein